MTDIPTPIRIAPSRLAYWGTYTCLRCFTAELHGWKKPRGIFSPVFTKLDAHEKQYLVGQPTYVISPSLPPGEILAGPSVKAAPYVGKNGVCLEIGGHLDAICKLDAGGHVVVDAKTSASKLGSLAEGYKFQLAAYAHCLENPLRHASRSVSTTGLLIFRPESMQRTEHGLAEIMSTTWIEVPWDNEARDSFTEVLEMICAIYENPERAPVSECEWCQIRLALAEAA